MAINRTSTARWEGDLKGGNGRFELGSGGISGTYTFASRFENGEGTNPEELIAAAEAACFAMALSNALASDGHTPDSVDATATVTLDGGRITTIHVVARGAVPGIDADTFQRYADEARQNCPISKVLAGADEITLEATLEQ
jgi:osmotically inducible protein OsmC